MSNILLVLILLSAILEIRGEYRPTRTRVYIFKPLTTALILLLALSRGVPDFNRYAAMVTAALVFSLIGDVLLMLPADRFILGLLSFLTAHVCYILAFTTGRGFGFTPALLAVFTAYSAAMYRFLWPSLREMKLPVLGYLLVISVMTWQAWERHLAVGGLLSLAAASGALLFTLSDSILALRRFRRNFNSAPLLVMATYYAAQLLIALSVSS